MQLIQKKRQRADLITVAAVAVLFAVMALFDTFVFNVVIAAICLLAIHEVFKAFRFEKAAYIYWGFVPYTLLVMFSDFHMVRICMLPASYIFALYLVLCVIGNSKSINYAKLGGMVLFSCIIMFCFYSLIYLKQLLPRATYGYDALYFIFLILGFAWGGDSAAYFAGRAFGKHKLAPRVSPKKSWEGFFAGLVGSALFWCLFTLIPGLNLGIPMAMAFGVISGLCGVLGDLAESRIKRNVGFKDSGKLLPGHGGLLDRCDSLFLVAVASAILLVAGGCIPFSW